MIENTPEPCWKGWYYSGSVPHRDVPHIMQFITFRLADSLPQTVLKDLAREQSKAGLQRQNHRWRQAQIERWLDAGLGCCALANPDMAEVMRQALLAQDGRRYRLVAWCLMPNHVHVLIEPLCPIGGIVRSWKTYTSRWAMLNNAEYGLCLPVGKVWMRDYWDRYIRDEKHFNTVVHYIHNNPVKAGLCAAADQWQWSSAACLRDQP